MSTVPHPTSDPVGFDDLSDTSAKHTPGPWTIENPRNAVGEFQITTPRNDGGDLWNVAQTFGACGYSEGKSQSLANARLIAAAPDLLRELLQARNYVAVVAKKTTDERVHHDLAQIDAAIAKAEGRSSP